MIVHFMNKTFSIPATDANKTLYEILAPQSKIKLRVPCGGHGVCKKCTAIAVHDSECLASESLTLSPDELQNLLKSTHFDENSGKSAFPVLICKTPASGISDVYLPDYSELSGTDAIKTSNHTRGSAFSPLSVTVEVSLPKISPNNKKSTDEILREVLSLSSELHILAEFKEAIIEIPADVLSQVSRAMHEGKARILLVLSRIFPTVQSDETSYITVVKVHNSTNPALGLAVDLGTTTICAAIVDLSDGKVLGNRVFENPQRKFGADVISRMSYSSDSSSGASDLMFCLRDSICSNICSLLEQIDASFTTDDITFCTLAGNSVMEHMFAGIDTKSISTSPFTLPTKFGFTIKSSECTTAAGLTLAHPNAPIYLAPLPASYVGGDISFGVTYLVTSKPELASQNAIILDLGTNGEICVIRNGGELYNSTSKFYLAATAAGPALEGANIKYGLPAVDGAIYSVELNLDSGEFDLRTIADAPPRGICGSGIISAVAAALDAGLVTEYGRIRDDGEPENPAFTNVYSVFKRHISESESGKTAVYLSKNPPIQLTNSDIRQVQIAKSAIAAGTAVLVKLAELLFSSVDIIYLAGSFGGGINPEKAARIGLLPEVNGNTASITEAVGNTSAKGAIEFMINSAFRNNLSVFLTNLVYIELSSESSFTEKFVDEMLFPAP